MIWIMIWMWRLCIWRLLWTYINLYTWCSSWCSWSCTIWTNCTIWTFLRIIYFWNNSCNIIIYTTFKLFNFFWSNVITPFIIKYFIFIKIIFRYCISLYNLFTRAIIFFLIKYYIKWVFIIFSPLVWIW